VKYAHSTFKESDEAEAKHASCSGQMSKRIIAVPSNIYNAG